MDLSESFEYLNIDSGERDFSKYPNAASFRIPLPYPIRNVQTCELLGLSIPYWSGMDMTIAQQGYLILDIPELNGMNAGAPSKSATAIVTMQPALSNERIILCKKIAERSVITYNIKKDRIDHLTIRIRTPDGTLCDLGTDTATKRQVNLTLKLSYV